MEEEGEEKEEINKGKHRGDYWEGRAQTLLKQKVKCKIYIYWQFNKYLITQENDDCKMNLSL